MDKLKRSDKQYTDIENFEEYEITECITFEMAVRAAKDLIINMHNMANNPLECHNQDTGESYFSLHSVKYKSNEKTLLEKYYLRDDYFFKTYGESLYYCNYYSFFNQIANDSKVLYNALKK